MVKYVGENGFQYTDELMDQLHYVGLEMLVEVDRICRKHHIKYEIDGGRLLGAVRNKGFIPWDDDVDVRMLRRDYDRFIQVCETELDHERFFLQTYHSDPGYRWGYGKLLRKGTVYEREHQEMLTMKKMCFMDIMPAESFPSSGPLKKLYNFESFIYRKISYSPVGAKYEKNPLYKMCYKLLSLIPAGVVRWGFDRLAYQYEGHKTKYTRTPGWGWQVESDGYLRSWSEHTCDLEFEGHWLMAPKDYDGYLRFLYGSDYMTPPPVEKQVPECSATRIDVGDIGKN
ncbi:MAG: LicD family protein [Eubacterium sp.]|nr:LicD family protein [Eubacterium sp.]